MSTEYNEQEIDYKAVEADFKRRLAVNEEKLANLKAEQAKLEKERAGLISGLEVIQSFLRPPNDIGMLPARVIAYLEIPDSSFSKLGLPEAAVRYLREVGTPQMTQDIAEGLLKRGVRSRSLNFTKTLLSTLGRARKEPGSPLTFIRHKWGLKEWEQRNNHPSEQLGVDEIGQK